MDSSCNFCFGAVINSVANVFIGKVVVVQFLDVGCVFGQRCFHSCQHGRLNGCFTLQMIVATDQIEVFLEFLGFVGEQRKKKKKKQKKLVKNDEKKAVDNDDSFQLTRKFAYIQFRCRIHGWQLVADGGLFIFRQGQFGQTQRTIVDGLEIIGFNAVSKDGEQALMVCIVEMTSLCGG